MGKWGFTKSLKSSHTDGIMVWRNDLLSALQIDEVDGLIITPVTHRSKPYSLFLLQHQPKIGKIH
jgi:hypothetical protein